MTQPDAVCSCVYVRVCVCCLTLIPTHFVVATNPSNTSGKFNMIMFIKIVGYYIS